MLCLPCALLLAATQGVVVTTFHNSLPAEQSIANSFTVDTGLVLAELKPIPSNSPGLTCIMKTPHIHPSFTISLRQCSASPSQIHPLRKAKTPGQGISSKPYPCWANLSPHKGSRDISFASAFVLYCRNNSQQEGREEGMRNGYTEDITQW